MEAIKYYHIIRYDFDKGYGRTVRRFTNKEIAMNVLINEMGRNKNATFENGCKVFNNGKYYIIESENSDILIV